MNSVDFTCHLNFAFKKWYLNVRNVMFVVHVHQVSFSPSFSGLQFLLGLSLYRHYLRSTKLCYKENMQSTLVVIVL